MSVPALRIPIRADVSQFQNDMKSTSSIAGTAVRTITKGVIDMNAGFLATQGAVGGTALAFRGVLGVLGPVLLGITAVSQAFKLMGYATDLAKAKIAEFNDIAAKANASNVSTDFFQRFTKSGAAILSLDQITAALKRFNEASTDKLGGSDVQQRVGTLKEAGNFTGNSGVAALSSSTTTEDKLRAVVALIDEAMQKGERLAALDIASKAFGAPVAAALQADNGYLDQMLKRADAMSNAKIISPEDVGRAIELKERMDAAQKTLAEKWKPVQDDLAKLGMNYHESWVGITESLASAVGYATALYTALNKVPDWFAKKIGGASVWQSITDATTTPESRAASEASLGISSDPRDVASVGQNTKLTAALQNHANVTRGMQQATDIQSAVRGDTSKKPTDAKADVNDSVDRAINTLQRHTEQTKADTQAVGLGDAALAKFRAQAAETAAVQANGGKETAEQAEKFKTLQQAASDAAGALAKTRVNSDISFGRQTAFLTPEDVAIAKQLAGIYGSDVPKALASSEAAELRFNNALKDVSQSIQGPLTTGLTDILDGTKSVSQGFADMGRIIVRSLEEAMVKMLIVAPLMQTLRSLMGGFGVGGGGGILGGILGLFGGGSAEAKAFAGGTTPMAKGGAFDRSNAIPFARGGIFDSPTLFKFANGGSMSNGVMGEAGPEAIMPLSRGPGGKLGVRIDGAGGGGSSPIVVQGGDTHITVQGNADEKTLGLMKQELAKRDAEFASNVVATVKRAQQGRHL
jgi:hypothetical protein